MINKTSNDFPQAILFLENLLFEVQEFNSINNSLFEKCGIIKFFNNEEEIKEFQNITVVSDNDRKTEFGDFQTNMGLADKVTSLISKKNLQPEVLIEPSCGIGNFIISSLNQFSSLRKIYAIEIFKPYIILAKLRILELFIEGNIQHKPEIQFFHKSIFDFNFNSISNDIDSLFTLIIGNPPWVTNSKLGELNSKNLPQKANINNQSGFDALTGKSNFDIAEAISQKLIHTFEKKTGTLAFLVKNNVIKNIIFNQIQNKYKIGNIEKHNIDCKKEFNAAADASLLLLNFKCNPEYAVKEYDIYSNSEINSFGWQDDKFVSNIKLYYEYKQFDGSSPFIWRQGLKHDCASIMELEKTNGCYTNKLNEKIILEDDLVFPFLKSSDLKDLIIEDVRKYVIITQRKIGEPTSLIKTDFPMTYEYLSRNIEYFLSRKSSIYDNKPHFSIFGIGDYSFKKYKVAVSSLYKTYHFSLILPKESKPFMLDDTCYFIGFDKLEFAVFTFILLNSAYTSHFLKSITFKDAKRIFTKDVLMRIDLYQISLLFSEKDIIKKIKELKISFDNDKFSNNWNKYLSLIKNEIGQTSMF